MVTTANQIRVVRCALFVACLGLGLPAASRADCSFDGDSSSTVDCGTISSSGSGSSGSSSGGSSGGSSYHRREPDYTAWNNAVAGYNAKIDQISAALTE